MWDQFYNLIPVVSFLAGLGGGAHCVGMCGGLVGASCSDKADVFRYQFGRLLGYLTLGAVAGAVGEGLSLLIVKTQLQMFSSLFIGALFILWGIRSLWLKQTEIPVPSLLSKVYKFLWRRWVSKSPGKRKSFFTGLFSILLPCGLLYGIVIGALALGSVTDGIISISFFWLGTLPAMVMAPMILQRVLNPFRKHSPRIYATTLILCGLLTIFYRGTNPPALDTFTGAESMKEHACH